jgi:xylulokinase
MDESTTAQCEAIARALGGRDAVAQLTGSAPFERFTGPQIRKFFETDPGAYGNTRRIHLVSSYLASLLTGRDAPVEPGDAAGTNLFDFRQGSWAQAALDATAPALADRLPPVVPSATVIGALSGYWRNRYGFGPAAVVAWTGDNPSALVGSGLFTEGSLGISLGTSDTLFGFSEEPRPTARGSCHVFGAPTGRYMSLVCFRNGSLAREAIRDRFGYDWRAFSRALQTTPAGNNGGLMLPWFEPEITPHVSRPGVRRRNLAADDAASNVRGVVEAQMMAMANHSAIVTRRKVERLLATGGASVNREILQVMADVFDAEVQPMAGGNAACLGAALRAFQAHEQAEGRAREWADVYKGVRAGERGARIFPVPANAAVYRELRQAYAEFERAETRAKAEAAN